MSIKKIVNALIISNILQFIAGAIVWSTLGIHPNAANKYLYLTVAFMLFNSLVTILGLYFASNYKNENLEESIKNLEELNTRLRAQRHDYLNHFQVIYGLMDLGDYEEAKKYIEPVFKDIIKVSKALKTAQPAVNALLQAKIEAAERKKIDLYLEVRSNLTELPIEPWNLCKILANLLDNSMAAFEKWEEGIEKKIYLDIGEDQCNYFFHVTNNGPQIPEDQLENIFKQGYTTKKEKEHGMGLYIVSQIVHEAAGNIHVTSNPEKTSFYIELPKRSINC